MSHSTSKAENSLIELQSQRLKVQIALPGSSYDSTRFDHSSFATSILLDEVHQFASAERDRENPLFSRGGQGLSCEFGIKTPIGYSDCPVGEWFPKLGVGFIRRESSADYNFFHHYAEMRPLNYQISRELPVGAPIDSQALTITGSCQNHRGFAWTMSRTWLVYGTTIENRCTLINTGSKTLETDEYSHNFIRPGNPLIGPDTQLDFSFPLATSFADYSDPSACLDGLRPVFKNSPAGEFFLGQLLDHRVEKAWWQVRNRSSGLSIREELDRPCLKCDLWGKLTVVSPELFTAIRVNPGESFSWTRRYLLATP